MKFSTIFIAAAVLALPVALSFAGEPSDQRESPEKMFQEGLSLFQNRNFDKAEKLFDSLIKNFAREVKQSPHKEKKLATCEVVIKIRRLRKVAQSLFGSDISDGKPHPLAMSLVGLY